MNQMLLVDRIVNELPLTRIQAEGGVGLLLQLASERLSSADFQQVIDAIPAISDVIGKAPRDGVACIHPLWTTLSHWYGGVGPLSNILPGCEKLQIDKRTIRKLADLLASSLGECSGSTLEKKLRRLWH